MKPLKVCFVALHSYPVINPKVKGAFGGIETRAWTFAKSLARSPEFEVQFVVQHERLKKETVVDNVRIIPKPIIAGCDDAIVLSRVAKRKSFPWIRISRFTSSLLWRLPYCFWKRASEGKTDFTLPDSFFSEIDAAIFLPFGVQSTAAQVVASAQITNRPAVLFVGSDGDIDERYLPPSQFVSPYGDKASDCFFVLKQTDAIFVQTKAQQTHLKEKFHRDSQLIRNPINLDIWRPLTQDERKKELKEPFFLWVGRAESVHKRPHLCIEIAKTCPEVSFVMVMNPKDSEYEKSVRANAPKNVTFRKFVEYADMPELMRNASGFISTSSLEGFPNVFLQAAASGVPVLSLNVGEEFLNETQAGFFAGDDLETMIGKIKELSNPKEKRFDSGMQEQVRGLVQNRHGLDKMTELLGNTLKAQIKNS